MTRPVGKQSIYWGIAAAIFLVVLWALGNAVLPFILAGAIAYVLDPVADRLERMGLSRVLAVVAITLVAILIFILVVLLVIPTLISQTAALIETVPQLFTNLQHWLTEKFPEVIDEGSVLRQQLVAIGELIKSKGPEVLQGLVGSALSLINVAVLVVVVPVVTFYLLLDWDRLIANIDTLLPRDHAPTIRKLAGDIDQTLASFIRGQGLVCLIQGLFYAGSLMALGLNFGIVIGAFAGLVTFIPYVGALLGGALAIGLALFQFWGEWWWIAAVVVVFFIGQFIEGNILTPNLVGSSVGLHPVWLLFALSAFGAAFGFVGLLVAVPVSAMIGVLVRFGIERYRASRLYQGTTGDQ